MMLYEVYFIKHYYLFFKANYFINVPEPHPLLLMYNTQNRTINIGVEGKVLTGLK